MMDYFPQEDWLSEQNGKQQYVFVHCDPTQHTKQDDPNTERNRAERHFATISK